MTGKTTEKKISDDVLELHRALSDLVRIYQFRDRTNICCHDISVTQCYALEALIKHGPLTLNELSGKLYLEKSTASRVINALERKEYVHRSDYPADGRAISLGVTAKGKNLYEKIELDLTKVTEQLSSGLKPDVLRAAIKLLNGFTKAAVDRCMRK